MGAAALPRHSLPRPAWDWAFGILTWGLCFHVAFITLLNGPLQIPQGIVRLVAAWKEVALVALGVAGALRLVRQTARFRPAVADVAVVALVLIVLMRGALDWAQFGLPPWSPIEAYGARDLLVPFFLYGIGRVTPEVLDSPTWISRLAFIALVISLLGFAERLLPIEALVIAGVPAYFRDFLNVEGMTNPFMYGLPHAYFTDFGTEAVRRAGSVFLSGQGFAIALMLVLPAVQLHAMDAPPGARAQRWVVFGIVWCALLLSITRMTIMACAIQAILLLLLTRRTMAVGTLATMGAGLALAAVAASGDVRDFVWRTLSFDTQSSVSHIADWTDGVEAMWDYPVGAGLATADLTAARFDRGPLSADNLLFKYGVELGWPGLLVFVLFFVALLAAGMRLSRRAGGPTRSGALFTIAVTTAILINGATSVVTNLPFLAYVWAWIAGATVARERQIPHHSVTA